MINTINGANTAGGICKRVHGNENVYTLVLCSSWDEDDHHMRHDMFDDSCLNKSQMAYDTAKVHIKKGMHEDKNLMYTDSEEIF